MDHATSGQSDTERVVWKSVYLRVCTVSIGSILARDGLGRGCEERPIDFRIVQNAIPTPNGPASFAQNRVSLAEDFTADAMSRIHVRTTSEFHATVFGLKLIAPNKHLTETACASPIHIHKSTSHTRAEVCIIQKIRSTGQLLMQHEKDASPILNKSFIRPTFAAQNKRRATWSLDVMNVAAAPRAARVPKVGLEPTRPLGTMDFESMNSLDTIPDFTSTCVNRLTTGRTTFAWNEIIKVPKTRPYYLRF